MGEVPILTISAQVFQIDHETKKKWIPLTQQPVAVSLYQDASNNTYRIICIDDNKVIINCFVKPRMKFLMTSQKFGQWVDGQAATVYGIGCKSEVELMKFIEKIEEVKELIMNHSSSNKSPSYSPLSHQGSSSNSDINDDKTVNGLLSKLPPKKPLISDSSSAPPIVSASQSSSKPSQIDLKCTSNKCSGVVTLLRAENDRLKLELAQSSSKAKEWEAELQTLRNNNVTLTTALEESRRSSEDWQKQLKIYKDEIVEAKTKLSSLDACIGQLNEARDRLKEAERMSAIKEEELIKLRQQYSNCRRLEVNNRELTTRLEEVERDNERLTDQVKELTFRLDGHQKRSANQNGLRRLQEEISSKINELYAMNDLLADEMQAYLNS